MNAEKKEWKFSKEKESRSDFSFKLGGGALTFL